MIWGSTLVTPPDLEPISLQEAKDHLRVDDSDSDSLIEPLIQAAREYAETFTRRALITQTWNLFLDRFPFGTSADPIRLPYAPLISVTSVKYTDIGGVQQTVSAPTYIVDNSVEPGQITLAYLAFWPTYQQIAKSISVRFVAGYGANPDSVPRQIRQAMLLMIGHWYTNREVASSGPLAEIPMGARSLLWGSRVSL